MNSKCFSKNLYKLYVFCLPLGRLFDLPFGDFFNKVITQFSTLLMLVGCFVLLINQKSLINSRNKLFLNMYFFMAFSSIFMSIFLFFNIDCHYQSPLFSIIGDIVLYFFVLLSIFYNSYCLSNYITLPELYKVFNWQIVVLLVVGYVQFFAILGFSAPYSVLSSIFSLKDLSWLRVVDRGVTFFGTEPSSAAILCFVVLPYLFTTIYIERGFKRLKYIVALLLFIFLVLGSNSSQVLILFIASVLLFIWSCFRPIKKVFYYVSFLVGFIFAYAYISIDSTSIIETSDTKSLEYAILGKIVDRENQSTAMRASTVINDLKIFTDYPLMGVGDGNQGYFYAKNQPSWTLSSEEVSNLIASRSVPNGGGNFFPAYISAYGIIGIIIFIMFISKYRKLYNTSFLKKDKRIDTIFQISIILFLFSAWHVVGVKQSETIIFVLSLPCVKFMANKFNYV